MRAKKSLGQHFLRNPRTAQRIVDAVAPDAKTIIEIGPGQGVLTDYLAARSSRLILIEKDDHLASGLADKYGLLPNVEIVHGDVLRVDFAALTDDPNTTVIGNFPYNISSQIVFKVLNSKAIVSEMIGMFQYEMAMRIISGPGSKDYGVISVLTQTAYSGRLLFTVGPGQFNPPPKVKSAVIRLERHKVDKIPCDFQVLRRVVKASFLQRRKMLRNTMKPFLPAEVIREDDLFTRRPEQLSLEEFYAIANLVAQYDKSPKGEK